MKKIGSITITLMLASMFCMAQSDTIKTPAKTKPQFRSFYVVPPFLLDYLMQATRDYKSSLIYNPQYSAEEKLQIQVNIDANLAFIVRNVKMDSVAMKVDTTKIKTAIKDGPHNRNNTGSKKL